MMKKSIFALGLMLSALALTNCTNNNEDVVAPDVNGGKYEIYAAPATRTVADGVSTTWGGGDAINLFHAEAGATTYANDGKFSITAEDIATGRFTGTLASALTADAYDWYAIYPYNEKLVTPGTQTAGYTTVGKQTQTQTGNNSQAHIAGVNVPLYGQAKGVAKGTNPAMVMKHLTTLMKFNITNPAGAGSAITVSSIRFETASQLISGTYYVNFADATVDYASSGEKYTYKDATLSVTSGEAIAAGASASFYLAVKPFTAPIGEKLTVTVTLSDGKICTKEKTLTAETTFTAGNTNNMNIEFVADAAEDYSGTYVVLATNGSDYYALSSTASTTRLASVNFSYNGTDTSVTTGDATLVWTVAKEAGKETYTLANDNKYVAWTSASDAKTQEAAYSLLIVPGDKDNTYHIKPSVANTRILARNENNPYFAFYSGTQYKDLYLIPATYDTTPVINGVTTSAATGTATTVENGNGTTATLNGSYSGANLEESTVTCGFEYKLSSAAEYTSVIASTPAGTTPFSADLTDLTTDSEYTFRAWASLNGGTTKVYGDALTFTPTLSSGETQSYQVTYVFGDNSDFSTWSNSYAKHTWDYSEATVVFEAASKQTSSITDQPVTKGKDVSLKMTNGGIITDATFVCTKWTSKTQTITLYYSIDGGTSWTTTGITSNNFTITGASLPVNTNAVKIGFSSTSNQIGIKSVNITYTK